MKDYYFRVHCGRGNDMYIKRQGSDIFEAHDMVRKAYSGKPIYCICQEEYIHNVELSKRNIFATRNLRNR